MIAEALAPCPADFLPADATWAGVLLVLILALFLAAATIGAVARLTMPEAYAEPILRESEPPVA